MAHAAATADAPLSTTLPGTWRLLTRTDVTSAGQTHPDPALGSDPIALLIYEAKILSGRMQADLWDFEGARS